MESTVVTIERENDSQKESQSVPKLPDVSTFKEIVKRHCTNWSVTSVEDLCTQQTQALIEELAQHFG
jgi:hypothetical protein